MNNEQTTFLLNIFERFGDKAQAALDFVKANSKKETKEVVVNHANQSGAMPDNGIYVIYKDGSFMKFEKDDEEVPTNENAVLVGIIQDGHSFAVVPKELGRFKLVKDYEDCPDESDLYIRSECEALNDWDCITKTKHLQEVGTDIPLKDGEYIPSLPMLVAMMYWRKRGLNEALQHIGGDPISDSYHWSSTEYNSNNAWGINGESGYIYINNESNSIVVRAVCAWNL